MDKSFTLWICFSRRQHIKIHFYRAVWNDCLSETQGLALIKYSGYNNIFHVQYHLSWSRQFNDVLKEENVVKSLRDDRNTPSVVYIWLIRCVKTQLYIVCLISGQRYLSEPEKLYRKKKTQPKIMGNKNASNNETCHFSTEWMANNTVEFDVKNHW